jgi:membrane protein DedA with SNARE-associated domain
MAKANLATSIRVTQGNAKDMGDSSFPKRTFSFVPRNKYLALVAFGALFLSVVELTDIFQLPFESSFGGAASSGGLFSMNLLTSLLNIGYAGLFILMAMESASLPVPSEVVLPFAGYLVFLGKMNLGLAILDGAVALLVGALVDYYLALWLGRPVVYRLLGRMGISSTHLDNGERWVDSKGAWSVFVARFIPGIRSVISIPAGLLRMKLKPFVILTFAGSLIWSAVLIYVGYSAGPLWQSALDSLSLFAGQAALVVVAVLSVLYVVYFLGPFGRKG